MFIWAVVSSRIIISCSSVRPLAQGLSFSPFSLLPPDQGPSLLHSCIGHDHCKTNQEQTQAAAGDEDSLVTKSCPFPDSQRLWAPLEALARGRAGVLPMTVGFKTTLWNSGYCSGFWILRHQASLTALPLCSGDLDGLLPSLSFLVSWSDSAHLTLLVA